MQQFDKLIMKEVSAELLMRFPDRILSITQVHVSKDLSFAKIWLSADSKIDDLVKSVQEESKAIRKVLSKNVVARRVPSLYFVADKTEEKAQHIEQILAKIKKSK
jgi:ribosome-binding factor A